MLEYVLASGKHGGFHYVVTHRGTGYRYGYVRIPAGHPWHGKHYGDIAAEVHGGLTYSDFGFPCESPGMDDSWWVGFDCAHAGDLKDYSLPMEPGHAEASRAIEAAIGAVPPESYQVRTTEYVEAECRDLCEQAEKAALSRD